MSIRVVGVCGAAGTMGAGIAIVAARAGYRTICHDLDAAALDRAAAQTAAFFAKSVERGKLAPEARDRILADMERSTDLGALGACDLVIEAVFEELPVKRELLARLDAVCPPHTIFASNTSTLSITEIAAGCSRLDRVLRPDSGAHRGPAGLHPQCAARAFQQRRHPRRGGRRGLGRRHRQGRQSRARVQDGPAG